MRRKLISSLLLFVLIFSAVAGFSATNTANAADTTVYVTFSKEGATVVAQEPIVVTDVDNDGKLTINDAFILFHTKKCSSGAEGYASTGWITKFWGEDGPMVGYFLNNTAASSTNDEIANGDYLAAFFYTDTSAYSDKYTYFDVNTKNTTTGTAFTLTLTGTGYDENYATVTAPLADATITVDGVATTVKTDAEGKATITLPNAGKAVISATSATTIVPPVCTVTVTAATPNTGVAPVAIYVLVIAVVALAAAIAFKKGFDLKKN